jgi:hypothetical protein
MPEGDEVAFTTEGMLETAKFEETTYSEERFVVVLKARTRAR